MTSSSFMYPPSLHHHGGALSLPFDQQQVVHHTQGHHHHHHHLQFAAQQQQQLRPVPHFSASTVVQATAPPQQQQQPSQYNPHHLQPTAKTVIPSYPRVQYGATPSSPQSSPILQTFPAQSRSPSTNWLRSSASPGAFPYSRSLFAQPQSHLDKMGNFDLGPAPTPLNHRYHAHSRPSVPGGMPPTSSSSTTTTSISYVLPVEKDVMLLSDEEVPLGAYSFADPRFNTPFLFGDKLYQQPLLISQDGSEYEETTTSSSSPVPSYHDMSLSATVQRHKASSQDIEENDDDENYEVVGVRPLHHASGSGSGSSDSDEGNNDSGSDYEEQHLGSKPPSSFYAPSTMAPSQTSSAKKSRARQKPTTGDIPKVPKRRGPVPSYIVYAESIAAHTKKRALEALERKAALAANPNAAEAEEKKEAECANCGTKNTSLWRRGRDNECLCNPCGLYYRLHNVARPLELKTDVIKKRSRGDSRGAGKKKKSANRKPKKLE